MSLESKLIRHQIFLERYAGTLAKMMQSSLNVALQQTLGEIASKQLDQINPVAVEDIITRMLVDDMDNIIDQLKQFVVVEKDFNKRVVEREIKDFIEDVTALDLIEAMLSTIMPVGLANKESNRKLESSLKKFAEQNAKKMVQPIKDTQLTGGDILEAGAAITALTNGLLSVQSKALSKTIVTHASNTSKNTLYKANDNLIKEVEWVSVLDSNTTDYCRGQAGKRWPVGQGPRPPAHYNCRSITKPVVE